MQSVLGFVHQGFPTMEKLQAVDWRGLYKSATNTVKKYAKNMSELEIQVEDATNAEVR